STFSDRSRGGPAGRSGASLPAMSSPKRPGPPESPNRTLVSDPSEEQETQRSPPSNEEAPPNDGATAFLRVPPELAPRKGLQVSLPDDEPAPPPSPKRVIARPPPDDAKGRRGAWWDEKSAPIPDEEPPPRAAPVEVPSPDEEKGATAFLRIRPPPAPPPER